VVLGGSPQFTMGEIEEKIVGSDPGSYRRIISEGKTPRGDTLYIEYRIGRSKPGSIQYNLHLKALPEEANRVEKRVRELMEEFLSTVPKWDGKS
jgi:MOSC domain-containing protein YiiM